MIKTTKAFVATGQSSPVEPGGSFDVSITGTWVASINLERSLDKGVTWGIVKTYTANAEEVVTCASRAQFRFNCTAYTSGSALCVIGAGAI